MDYGLSGLDLVWSLHCVFGKTLDFTLPVGKEGTLNRRTSSKSHLMTWKLGQYKLEQRFWPIIFWHELSFHS